MNIFYLDEDLEKCAEYHINSHVSKMPTEATQLLTTTIWVDHLLGFVPRALTREELGVINEFKASQPSINERTFTRFLPSHPNHPCAIWARSSAANYEWLFGYASVLNDEYRYRWDHDYDHKSFTAATKLPEPRSLSNEGITVRPMCMPDEYKEEDVIASYRMYYMMDKADMAVWKKRQKPEWWDENFVQYMHMDPHQAYINTTFAPPNRNKPHGQERFLYVRS